DITDQYLFGDGLMVCPVLSPMYYERESRPLPETPKTRRVYLPKGSCWYDYWTNACFEGGQWIDADAPIEKIPLFVREGSILPRAECSLSTEEMPDEIEAMVYSGRSGEFLLYEDAGDGYGYEQGQYLVTRLSWDEEEQELSAQRICGSAELEKVYRIHKIAIIRKNGTVEERESAGSDYKGITADLGKRETV
ncbi:MAG: DUF5110 domain-containing protein, partial [Acetatifactor sp.]|nr:DUF5110 domain-containing protein [Acetatifactor sp.]